MSSNHLCYWWHWFNTLNLGILENCMNFVNVTELFRTETANARNCYHGKLDWRIYHNNEKNISEDAMGCGCFRWKNAGLFMVQDKLPITKDSKFSWILHQIHLLHFKHCNEIATKCPRQSINPLVQEDHKQHTIRTSLTLWNWLSAPLLIEGFPMVLRVQQEGLWFGRSQHDKQNKQTAVLHR
jgi:hypothetical protein